MKPTTQPAPPASPAPQAQLDNCLIRWRNNLIDLTRRNPLLSLKPNRTSYLEITAPAAQDLFMPLVQKTVTKGWPLHLPPAPEETKEPTAKKPSQAPGPAPLPKPGEIVTTETERQRLLLTLTNLHRRTQADFRERGLHILHLAFGILEWRGEDEEIFRSPLVLVPVGLERRSLRDPFVLVDLDEDPFLNPALLARLKLDHAFQLSALPDWEEKKLTDYLALVQEQIHGLPGWKLEPTVALSLFSFFKGVIYQDLEENAGLLKENAIVRSLGGQPWSVSKATSLEEKDLDERQDPAKSFHILDADGSQRLCLEAAARGDSFVLIGPPGTGKSQTIANLIADRIAQGKKVLFVSEKMAALEVVYNRLCHVGLGDYCLELHSHKTNKKAVVTELARCLDDRAASKDAGGAEDHARLQQRREQLNRYVRALHQVRAPMQRSLWDALAEIPRWRDVPTLPLGLAQEPRMGDTAGPLVVTEFSAAQLDELRQTFHRLEQLWAIHTDANYPWKGFKGERFTLQLKDEVISLIDKVRARLDKLLASADDYERQVGVKVKQGDARTLLKLGDLLETRPAGLHAPWLANTDQEDLAADLERCAEQYQRLGQARTPLTNRYGLELWRVAEGAAQSIESAWKEAALILAPGDEAGAALLAKEQKLRGWAADTLKRLPTWLGELRTLEKWLAVPLPVGEGAETGLKVGAGGDTHLDPSLSGVRHFLRLANLCQSENAPERTWVHDEKSLHEAKSLLATLRPTLKNHRERRQRLLQVYTEEFFELDHARLATAFAGPYQGWWRWFKGAYRRDRRAILRRTRNETWPDTVAEDVAIARDLLANQAMVVAEQPRRQGVLGRYEKGLDTDADQAALAAQHAEEALTLLKQLDCFSLPARFVDALCALAPPAEKIRACIKRLNESVAAWQHLTEQVQGLLPMASLPGVGQPLEDCSLSALQHFAKDLQTKLNQLGAVADPLLSKAPSPPADFATLIRDVRQAEELRTWERDQEAESRRWEDRFGPTFIGIETNWESLRRGLTWVRRLRELWSGAAPDAKDLPSALVQLAVRQETPPPVKDLRQAQEQFEHALHNLEQRFDSPGPMLQGLPLKDQAPLLVKDRLQHLRDRAGDLADWIDWRQLPVRFAHQGLGGFWESLLQAPPTGGKVVDLFLKSFWTSWCEAHLHLDPVLSQFRRADHERVLAEFRDLDRQLIQQGASRVSRALEGMVRQEGDLEGGAEVALVRREANKKTRHVPLRDLFDRLPTLLPRLKPCLLMSPLSVSQFLPPDKLRFDLVVFDEASQILPEDAVGAIYRGQQLVVTGDNQQLPPTTFFQQTSAADDAEVEAEEQPVFESVLDACLAAGLPQKMLRWHYRSRHEQLIAFSNNSFYQDRLVTFPAALADSPALGVKFHYVKNGRYDRGGRRDNPVEAGAVADLVMEHFRTQPSKTLGVIAFSYAQMNAIQDEIDQRLRAAPDLEKFFQGDRLEGFFVKNLETVQGDERDVILLSVGYGPDEQGKLTMNFGPLIRQGGERRLNVAVTRARQKMVVVSSVRASDFDGAKSASPGISLLHKYLQFAQGVATLGSVSTARPTVPKGDAVVEDIADVLRTHGLAATSQVGCGPFRIDLGVYDPKTPGQYLLGIELDGPNYAQAAVARDRDRLRPLVLEQLGWKLHRLWAPDWLQRRQEEVERLLRFFANPPVRNP